MNSTIKIAILGYGRMGKTIERLLAAKGEKPYVIIDTEIEFNTAILDLKLCDVAIDFSSPDSAYTNITKCIDIGLPIVSGTTGWLDKMDHVKDLCAQKKGAFLYASNFSVGVNILFAMNKKLAKMMGTQTSYNVEMEEIHHIHKLDEPSGTAITLANQILKDQTNKDTWSLAPNTTDNQLTITSKRIGEVPGTHIISYASEVDTLELKHTAHSRDGFATGAILAANWLVGKEGCFGMEDVLELG